MTRIKVKCPKCKFEYELQSFKRLPRSNQQNNYLWLIYELIAEYSGDNKDSIHEYCKNRFLSVKIEVMGENLKVVKSTSSLKTDEFNEYVDKVKQFAAEMGLVITDYNEVNWEN